MRSLRALSDQALRRARLLAARTYPVRSITRSGILTGRWDGGSVVRAFLGENKEGDVT